MKSFKPGAAVALFLSTSAFAVSFAVWGLIGALAPTFAQTYGLSAKAKSLMIAIPVLLGALGRIPAGMLADRFGGRRVFAALLLLAAIPAVLIGLSNSYTQLIGLGLFLGIAGSTFPVGVGFTSKWFTPDQQGTALGVYGMGNIGQSVAVFGAPVLAIALGSWRPVFFVFAAISAHLGSSVLSLCARCRVCCKAKDDRRKFRGVASRAVGLGLVALLLPNLRRLRRVFDLSPQFAHGQFKLSAADAGARTAGFVLLATLMRPVGGMLADRLGGARVLVPVFIAVAVLGALMGCPWMPTFTVGALGAAAALGLGNGAVFKLVPQYFPKETATVTGLVGAFGGLGGFFPPLVLGVLRDATGAYTWGFIFLAIFALGCLAVNYFVFLKPSRPMQVHAMS